MRTIGVVTGSRADYSIYAPLLKGIEQDSHLKLVLFVTGMHLSSEFGLTAGVIQADGYPVAERVDMLLSSDTPEGIAKSMGLGCIGFSQAYARTRPDILVVLGDRFEMHAAALAALPFKMPVAHIHGGEVTRGAFDDALRHCITKLSHLHFVSTQQHARRVVQMGEELWRVTVAGSLSLDDLADIPLLSVEALENQFLIDLSEPPLLVTYHPVTLQYEQAAWQIEELLAALEICARPVIFTMPNADTAGRTIADSIDKFVEQHPFARKVDNFGRQAYFSMLSVAAAMVGNSSSGIIEAPSFRLPVVNIGTRQEGREMAANVIQTGYGREEITLAIRQATSPEFVRSLNDLVNPYGCGRSAEKMLSVLRSVTVDDRLLVKQFYDLPENV